MHAFQRAFFRKLGGEAPLRAMFDALGLAFAVKDAESRVVCASGPILKKFGLSEAEIVGTTDRDRYPARLAEVFRKSDREVVESGRPVIDRLEVWYDATGALDWCRVTKLPLRDRRGKVVGVMMVMRPWSGRRELGFPLVERIRREPGAPHRVSELARRAGLSPRQLQRRFVELFGVGVKEFVTRARIREAAGLLRSTARPIAEIALDCGFYDQSAFTRAFRRRAGMTPDRYRRKR
ncbi:MAG TPA: helix-turn-helix domain-containing protein [Planctomycetota bacterium]